MTTRVRGAAVILAAVIPGLLFAPVFGLTPLLLPVAVVAVACYAVVELGAWVSAFRPWQSVTALVVGLAALVVTEFGGVPSVKALVAGVTQSWQLTLQSTWPARADVELIFFVPTIVLVAAVIGLELSRWPAVALVPSLAAVILSQAFVPVNGRVALLVAVAYIVVAMGLYADSLRRWRGIGIALVCALVPAVGIVAVDSGNQPAYSLQQNRSTPLQLPRKVSPLAEIASRMHQPDVPVFSYTSNEQLDRWRLVVLTGFDGVTWSPSDQYRRLGAELVSPVSAPTTLHSAKVSVPPGDNLWIPSQAIPASVTGVAPQIQPESGMLFHPSHGGLVTYDISWREPDVDALRDAALDPVPIGDLGQVPPGIAELARTATGNGRPSFTTALTLERYLTDNYRTATGADLPTGSGWPQLKDFLLDSKRGTSEQFAAAYVALARIVGIPARLAVGYRAPKGTGTVLVRNRDVLAWPEVAVAGVGWVPLDPAGAASGAGPGATKLAQVTEAARVNLPPTPPDPPVAPPVRPPNTCQDCSFPWLPIGLGVLALLVLLVVAVPVARAFRTYRRRRARGAKGVVAAWREARDLLRAHGAVVTPGMTARDLAFAAHEASIADGLTALAGQVDLALWSGAGANDGTVERAWAAVRDVRRGLATRPLGVRVRAAFTPRGLLGDPSRT